jgi:chromosome segregation ATPase
MLCLFTIDILGLYGKYFGLKNFRSLDFKTPIVSIGLFGTFYGVLVGLYGFDSRQISQSVPRLLEGLKFAFAISVLGMFLSLTLSILDKFTGGLEEDTDILRSIDKKMGGLITTLQSPAELVSQFTEMKTFLKKHLEKINLSLDKALDQLGRGATQEVIQALDKIITEFNKNLQAQFGENFKELNKACYKMVEWQDKYKSHVDIAEERLKKIMHTLDEANSAVSELAHQNKETTDVCRQVGGLISTYDFQVKTLATHLESCKTLGQQAGNFLSNTEKALTLSSENLNSFSGLIENSVSKQSETLAQLTKDIDDQLPKALGELEKVLTNITNQFAADYRSLFQFITDKK